MQTTTILQALSNLRIQLVWDERELHQHIKQELEKATIPYQYEYKLSARCRVDFFINGIAIEVKKRKPNLTQLQKQLERYANCKQVRELIVVVERSVHLPSTINEKPIHVFSTNRLWGFS